MILLKSRDRINGTSHWDEFYYIEKQKRKTLNKTFIEPTTSYHSDSVFESDYVGY